MKKPSPTWSFLGIWILDHDVILVLDFAISLLLPAPKFVLKGDAFTVCSNSVLLAGNLHNNQAYSRLRAQVCCLFFNIYIFGLKHMDSEES